jgi:DNA-binding CsgD family transcriptional regulator
MQPNTNSLRAVSATTILMILAAALIYSARELNLFRSDNWWGLLICLPACVLITTALLMWRDPTARIVSLTTGFIGGALLITGLVLFDGGDFARYWPAYAIWAGTALGLVCLPLIRTNPDIHPYAAQKPNALGGSDMPATLSPQKPPDHHGPEPIDVNPLSERELDVIRLLDSNLSQKEIATELTVASSTIKAHLRNIYGKLGVNTREEALQKARALGLLPQ